MTIRYVEADATRPQGTGPAIIAHGCNDGGHWGAGFSGAVSDRWPEPERYYRGWAGVNKPEPLRLGAMQMVIVEDDLWVANMITQHGISGIVTRDIPPIRYEAVDEALTELARHASDLGASVHMPRIGAGLAGGQWDEIEPLVVNRLADIDVTVYTLPSPYRRRHGRQ
jgi:O-acetyl-ADP-ribose deacetylase (regulator of RNase III)